jgi:hypothetical protein
MSDASFERDLRIVLSSMAPSGVPSSVYDKVRGLTSDVAARRQVDWFGWFASAATATVAITLLAVIGVLALSAARHDGSTAPGADGHRTFTWDSGVVKMAADGVFIDVGGKSFVVPADASVRSDPGTPSYRTLEFTWRAQGVGMRLNIYFEVDGDTWRVGEIRTYDGGPNGQWIYYRAPQLTALLGMPFQGDVTLSGRGDRGSGVLRLENVLLDAFGAGSGIRWQAGCTAIGPKIDSTPVNASDPRIHLQVGMDAREASAWLTTAGICHEFRLLTRYDETNGYSAVWCIPPAGTLSEWSYGTEGQLIVFVDAPETQWDGRDLVGC